LNQNCPEVV